MDFDIAAKSGEAERLRTCPSNGHPYNVVAEM